MNNHLSTNSIIEMDQTRPPHVLIFPLPLQGPVNFMFKLAELLCLAGLHVTFLVTEHIHGRLLRHSNIQARLSHYSGFQLKSISDGLPDEHPRSGDKFMELFNSLKFNTRPIFKKMLTSGCLSDETRRPVNFIISDGCLGFTCDVANEIGIPIVYARTMSPCCLWVFFCLPKLIEAGELPFNQGDDLDVIIKSVPGTETFLRRRDLPGFCRLGDLEDEQMRLCQTEGQENSRAHGLILNTFDDLDGPILSHMRTVCRNLYIIGPIHELFNARLSSAQDKTPLPASSSSLWQEDRSCMTWLDSKPSKSVMYVSFGSIATLTRLQLTEIWHGLVNSGFYFLWVIRPDLVAGKEWGKDQIPAEFREGTKQRGYIVSWAPQKEVLAHLAVGGFLTHNGWNSTFESIFAGVPMICWPNFLDQQVNSRFVSEVWRLGLDMKDTCDRSIVEKMVRELMDVRKQEFSKRAVEMAELARKSLREGGSSFCQLDRLVRDIRSLTQDQD